MAQCRYCHRKVSYRARACPGCGEPNPGRQARPKAENDYVAEDLLKAVIRLAALTAVLIAWSYSDDVDNWTDIIALSLTLWGSAIVGALAGIVLCLPIVWRRKIHIDNRINDAWLNGLKYCTNLSFALLTIWSVWTLMT